MNKQIEKYRKKANRIIKTMKLIGISLFLLGVLISIVQYAISKSRSDIKNDKLVEEINDNNYEKSGTGITYYVAAEGNSSDGTDINYPMSLKTANSKEYQGNDRVLFKSGDTFYGTVSFNVTTIENSLFYIGSYGEGEKPIISGANIIKNKDIWEKYNEKIYKLDLSMWNNFEGIGRTYWQPFNIGFIEVEQNNIYGNRKTSIDLLVEELDFYCENKYLYVKCTDNPTNKYGNILITPRKNLIDLTDNLIIDNLNIRDTGGHGITKTGTVKNVIIRNCIIQNIGGCVQFEDSFSRYGNGIEFWHSAENTLVENCVIRNVYDAGYTVQGNSLNEYSGFKNNICRNNIFINCSYDIEMFARNDSNPLSTCYLKDQKINNNISINQGRGWGYKARPNKYCSAMFVLWNFQKENTSININENTYFNSIRINYINTSQISKELFKNGIQSNNNKYFCNNDVFIMNNYGLYDKQSILSEYNIDTESIFKILSTDELEVISYYEIINSDDYNQIKAYYNFFDEAQYQNKVNLGPIQGYKYKKDNQDVILVYNETGESKIPYTSYTATDIFGNKIENTGTLTISKEPILIYNLDETKLYSNISDGVIQKVTDYEQKYNSYLSSSNSLKNIGLKLENIKTQAEMLKRAEKTAETKTITNLIEDTYEQGNNIIKAYKSKEFNANYQDVSNMLSDLCTITEEVQKYCDTETNNVTKIDKTAETRQNIKGFENLYQYYSNDNVKYLEEMNAKAKTQFESISNDLTFVNNVKSLSSYYLSSWAQALITMYNEDYLANVKVDISYSNTNPTNQNVTATLVSNADLQVTNNSNSKEHIFTENGTFTFEYTIKGQALSIKAEVKNIDKTLPTITGVQTNKLYLDSVIPQVQDANLQEVSLYKNSVKMENYRVGDTISNDAHYKLTAKDKAGNEANVEFDISTEPAKVQYSTTNWTNQDVTASIVSNFDVQVNNNQNSNKYVFKQNGTFTFDITIKGTNLKLTAEVKNIDKTPPTITGIENNKLYVEKARPVVTDENLNEVKLYLNSNQVENYIPGSDITKEGFYKIVANDKAGNETSVEFKVMEKISKEYKIQGNYILNISNNSNLTDFSKQLNIKADYEIIRNNKKLSNSDKIATGDKLKLSGGQEYTLIVTGDINGDGDVNIQDLLKLRRYLLVKNRLEEPEMLAADSNLDGEPISIKDLIRMRILILTKGVT